MKQTAVDILYNFLYEMESFEGFDPYDFNQKKVFAKAKAMEKEQIKDAWNDGYDKGTRDRIEKISNPVGNAEQYYNNTFKSE